MTHENQEFNKLMEIVMKDRPKRHFLWTSNRDPSDYVFRQLLEDENYMELASWAISGSPFCQAYLAQWAATSPETKDEIIADLQQIMNEHDSSGQCRHCDSNDTCSCFSGHCPACDDTLCQNYKCKYHIPGAKELYLSTISK